MNEILNKEYIRPSTSLYAASILIVKKSNDDLRIYIDYRAFNSLIIKNRNLSPLIRETLAKLYITRIFSKFNIITVFNKIQIKKENKKKIAFLT